MGWGEKRAKLIERRNEGVCSKEDRRLLENVISEVRQKAGTERNGCP